MLLWRLSAYAATRLLVFCSQTRHLSLQRLEECDVGGEWSRECGGEWGESGVGSVEECRGEWGESGVESVWRTLVPGPNYA